MWQPGLPQQPSSPDWPTADRQRGMAQDSGWYGPQMGTGAACGSPSADAASPAPVGDPNRALHTDSQRAQVRADSNTAYYNEMFSDVTAANSAFQHSLGDYPQFVAEYTEGGLAPSTRVMLAQSAVHGQGQLRVHSAGISSSSSGAARWTVQSCRACGDIVTGPSINCSMCAGGCTRTALSGAWANWCARRARAKSTTRARSTWHSSV